MSKVEVRGIRKQGPPPQDAHDQEIAVLAEAVALLLAGRTSVEARELRQRVEEIARRRKAK